MNWVLQGIWLKLLEGRLHLAKTWFKIKRMFGARTVSSSWSIPSYDDMLTELLACFNAKDAMEELLIRQLAYVSREILRYSVQKAAASDHDLHLLLNLDPLLDGAIARQHTILAQIASHREGLGERPQTLEELVADIRRRNGGRCWFDPPTKPLNIPNERPRGAADGGQ